MKNGNDVHPAWLCLRAAGYQYLESIPEERDGILLKCPDRSTSVKVKVLKSTTPSGRHGRHRYGINVTSLAKMDFIAFFAEDERYMLLVPTQKLKGVFEPGKEKAQG